MSETGKPAPFPEIEVPPGFFDGPIVWRGIFGNDHPVELEIGFGKGGFLREAGPRWPERNFFGIERSAKYVRHTRAILEKLNLPNVRIARSEGMHFFEHFVPGDSLHAIHVYHPDPWPKKRHHKRRMVRRSFFSLAMTRLRPGGYLFIQTDHKAYYEFMQEELRLFVEEGFSGRVEMGEGAGEVVTHFARKYMVEGRSFYRMQLWRPGET